MMNQLLLLFLLISILISCSKELPPIVVPPISDSYSLDTIFAENCDPHVVSDCVEDVDKVNIRVRNLSLYEICNIAYNPYDTTNNFGSLMPGDTTCYIAMDIAYAYPDEVKFKVGNESRRIGKLDFFPPNTLDPGFYTYNFYVVDLNDYEIASGMLSSDKNDKILISKNTEDCRNGIEIDCFVPPNNTAEIQLRVINHSIFDYCSFTFTNSNEDLLNFENIRPGDSTCYLPIERIDDKSNKINFIVNETLVSRNYIDSGSDVTPTTPGKYTLHVAIGSLIETGGRSFLKQDD